MSTKFILPFNDHSATLDIAGGKGTSLSRLVSAGFPVPQGFHVVTDAYRLFVAFNDLQPGIMQAIGGVDESNSQTIETASLEISRIFLNSPIPEDISEEIVNAYLDLSSGDFLPVAVRSSATAEDLPDASFAGQQETFLNICGPDELLEAVRKCWASLWTARAIGYRARRGISGEGVTLAVVVQLLVAADSAGILFTANPITGNRDEIVINASWGLGEAVVGGLVTPDSIVLDKTSLNVINRDTAEKLIQTVIVEGGTKEMDIPEKLRHAPVLNDQLASDLGKLGVEIESLYQIPMDIEWAVSEGRISILQARPITVLPDPEPSPPTAWKLPKGAYAAMRNNIVELMTDPLTPLFKTLGLSAVNASMKRLLDGFLGDIGLLPGEAIIAVNEYAYYNGSVRFGPILKVIFDTRGIMKRMFTGAVERWTEDRRPKYIQIVESWEGKPWQEYSSKRILAAVRTLAESAIDAYGDLVSGVIPASWMSEAWFTFTYRFYNRKGDPLPPTFLMGFDSLPIRADKELFDLSMWANTQLSLPGYLDKSSTQELVAHLKENKVPSFVREDEWLAWHLRFTKYLFEYGHTIYNLDFGNPVPADDPAPLIEALKLYLRGEGVNPHERQRSTQEKREEAITKIESRLKGRRLKVFHKNLLRAQKYAPLREDGLADVGLSYPLLRRMLMEIGNRFVQGGVIEKVDDIFWLTEEEVNRTISMLDRGEKTDGLSAMVPKRVATWRAARKISPPIMLPNIKIFGKDMAELKAGGLRKKPKDSLKGVAASPGTVTAPACVLHGPGDFDKMKTGDVLVATLTTPAWTPLFARASAVVTDIGGPLSHGSIVAREYGIPAVLGTGSATSRIRDGQIVTVDGGEGVVTLIDSDK